MFGALPSFTAAADSDGWVCIAAYTALMKISEHASRGKQGVDSTRDNGIAATVARV